MKKKILLSTVTAAAIIFSGTAFNKAEAANVQCNPTNQVTNQEDAQKLMKRYAKYNVTFPAQWKAAAPTQQKVQTQQPVKQPTNSNVTAQKPTQTNTNTTTNTPATNTTNTTNTIYFISKCL